MHYRIALLVGTFVCLGAIVPAWAYEEFAHPPKEIVSAEDAGDCPSYCRSACPDESRLLSSPSVVRIHIGPTVRPATTTSAGLLAAVDLGRGPAGFRASAVWLGTGDSGLFSQYSGEINVDMGGKSQGVLPVTFLSP